MIQSQIVQERVQDIIERARREQSKKLNLSRHILGGKLEEIPDEVFDLPILETLILFDNNLREVSERIRELANLKKIVSHDSPNR